MPRIAADERGRFYGIKGRNLIRNDVRGQRAREALRRLIVQWWSRQPATVAWLERLRRLLLPVVR